MPLKSKNVYKRILNINLTSVSSLSLCAEILWRDWEDLSAQVCIPEEGSETGSLFEFRVMSYNILAQDLIEQSPHLYMHCHPDILNWNYRLTNLFQEIQHWDPDVSITCPSI